MTCKCKEQKLTKIKILREGVSMPEYGSDLASGFDVRAYDCVMWDNNTKELVPLSQTVCNGEIGWMIPPHTTVILKTGLAVACGKNEEVQARARSGYSLKSPMRISNGIGTIDADYRNEVGIIMDNNGQYGDWFIAKEERIAQLVVCPVTRPILSEVKTLDETSRKGGYGSTGRF